MVIEGKIFNTTPPTVRVSVADYLGAMNTAYNRFREQWGTIDNDWKREDERWQDEVARGWGDMGKKLHDQRQHNEKLREYKNRFSALRAEAQSVFDDLLAEADQRFERCSRPTPENLDLKLIELLKSDILTDAELISTTKDYEGNLTVLRALAPYLQDRATKTTDTNAGHALSALAVKCKNAVFDYRSPLEQFAELAVNALANSETTAFAYDKVLREKVFPESLEAARALFISEPYKGANK